MAVRSMENRRHASPLGRQRRQRVVAGHMQQEPHPRRRGRVGTKTWEMRNFWVTFVSRRDDRRQRVLVDEVPQSRGLGFVKMRGQVHFRTDAPSLTFVHRK